jgi:hypothetical protein
MAWEPTLTAASAYPTFTSTSKGFGTAADSSNPCMRMIVKKLGGESRFESKHLFTDHILLDGLDQHQI